MLENLREMKMMMNNFYEVMNREKQQLSNSLYRAYQQEIMEIEDYMSREIDEISAETSEMFQQVGEMYQRNYLYLNTIMKELSKHYYEFEYEFKRKISEFEYNFRESFMNYYRILLQKLEESKHHFNQVYQVCTHERF